MNARRIHMTTQEAIALENLYQIPTYARMPIVLARGEGSYVWDIEGRKYLDLYGGHCVALLGHSPTRVVEAIRKQAGQLLFYSNTVYNDTRARALERLGTLAPEGLRHIFFCNSGAEANETALKLARKHTRRPRILAMEGRLSRTHARLPRRNMERCIPGAVPGRACGNNIRPVRRCRCGRGSF